MGDIVKTGSKYSDEQRMEVAILYAISGNAKKVARQSGIPRTTIVGWKKQDWWHDTVTRIRSEKADEHRAKYSELVDKAQQVALEKLPDATALQAMTISGIGTDKIRLADNLPTTIAGRSPDMKQLIEQFEKLSQQYSEKNANVITVQHKSDEEE